MRYAIFARLLLDGAIAIFAGLNGKFPLTWMFVGLCVADAATLFL